MDKHTQGKLFLDNDICSWVIRNPAGMGPRDWMWIEVTDVDRAMVWVTKGYQYKYKKRNPIRRVNNVKFGMLKGLDYYVISQGISPFPAYFELRTWIERHTPPPNPNPTPFVDLRPENESQIENEQTDNDDQA